MISATKIGITRRNILWEGSYLALKVGTLRPFRSFFLLINPTRDFMYSNTIGITIRLAVQPVPY